MSLRIQIAILRACAVVCAVLNGIMVGIILIYLAWYISTYTHDPRKWTWVAGALTAEQGITQWVKDVAPTVFGGKDITRWLAVAAAVLFSAFFGRSSRRFMGRSKYLAYRLNFESWKAKAQVSDNAVILSPLHRTLDEMKTAKRKDRERLLKDFAHAKQRLDAMHQKLAFLAVDVVDSTGMKAGEDAPVVEMDFRRYRRFVETIFSQRGCMKSAWTPDGVMACFQNPTAAAGAARDIIGGLPRFNREVKQIRKDFSVRCGINAGKVYYDDSLALEELSDHVLDVAGHMQKHAAPNTICAAKPAMEPVIQGFEPSGRVIDGHEVYVWETRRPATVGRP
jgi:class 3 adenylate cyclase